MKKFCFLSVIQILFALTATAQESISVDDVMIAKGHKAYLAVRFQFNEAHDYVSYQFTVDLPDGISLVTDTYGAVPVIMGDGQPSAHYNLNLNATSHIVTCYSNPSIPIAVSSGLLMLIPIEAEGSLTVGSLLVGQLKDVEFTKNTGAVRTPFANADYHITITDKIILDENSPGEPFATDADAAILVKRTVKAGEWSTICMPFDMTADLFRDIFGDDAKLAYFTGYDVVKEGGNVTSLTINFEEDDLSEGFGGNYPYLIKTTKPIAEFTITATITPDDVEESFTAGKGTNKKSGKFIGTYQANTLVPENSLFVSGNKFYYSVGKTKMKAYRGYFTLNDVLADVTNASTRIAFSFGNEEPTGTIEMKNEGIGIEKSFWYAIDGVKVQEPKRNGIYIQKGKKKIIK